MESQSIVEEINSKITEQKPTSSLIPTEVEFDTPLLADEKNTLESAAALNEK